MKLYQREGINDVSVSPVSPRKHTSAPTSMQVVLHFDRSVS